MCLGRGYSSRVGCVPFLPTNPVGFGSSVCPVIPNQSGRGLTTSPTSYISRYAEHTAHLAWPYEAVFNYPAPAPEVLQP